MYNSKGETVIQNFDKKDKKALLAVAKFIANQDNKLTEQETENFKNLARQKGFEDFQEIFKEVDDEVTSLNDLSSVLNAVTNRSRQKDIVSLAIEMARADGYESSEEHDTIRYLCRLWDINLEDLDKINEPLLVTRVVVFIKGSILSD